MGAVSSQDHVEMALIELWLSGTVGAGSEHFPVWMTSCAVGPGLWHLSALQPSLLHLSAAVSYAASPPLVLYLPPSHPFPSPSCPLTRSPPSPPPPTRVWITRCFTRFAGKSTLSSCLWGALPPSPPPSPFHTSKHPLALPPTHQFRSIPLTPLSPLLGLILDAPGWGPKAGKREGLVVVGTAAENWEGLRWKLHQWLNHSQLRLTKN